MFNVGLGEILVISLIGLLVFGPNRLPEMMRSLGKAYRYFQAESQRATQVLKEGLEEPRTPTAPGIVDTPDPGVTTDVPPAVPTTTELAPEATREYEDT